MTVALVRMAHTWVHTWDMAIGAGIDSTIPPDLVEADFAASPPAFMDSARRAGVFGPAIDVDADADPQAVLLALYGRRIPGNG